MVTQNYNLNEEDNNNIKGTPIDAVKILDFGLSRILGKNEFSNDPYGSLCFKAPELIKHIDYNFKVDIWAIGITLFSIIYGELPFEKGEKEDIKYSIIYHPISFYPNNIISNFNYIKDNIDGNAIDINESSLLYSLMKDCLHKNIDKRFSIEQLVEKYISKF
jgi:serine/threonine protein kinase